MNNSEMREKTASQLQSSTGRVNQMAAFVGLDGFVDDILHVVDKRETAEKYTRLPTIAQYAERLAGAAGRSTNVELVSQLTKLGGNGPIMANALASFGLKVTYLGVLGYPNLHPVFADFAKRAEVHSIAEPGYTDALEFEDGKIMMGKHQSLKQMNWENIKSRFGKDKFAAKFGGADLIGFVNWTISESLARALLLEIRRDVAREPPRGAVRLKQVSAQAVDVSQEEQSRVGGRLTGSSDLYQPAAPGGDKGIPVPAEQRSRHRAQAQILG